MYLSLYDILKEELNVPFVVDEEQERVLELIPGARGTNVRLRNEQNEVNNRVNALQRIDLPLWIAKELHDTFGSIELPEIYNLKILKELKAPGVEKMDLKKLYWDFYGGIVQIDKILRMTATEEMIFQCQQVFTERYAHMLNKADIDQVDHDYRKVLVADEKLIYNELVQLHQRYNEHKSVGMTNLKSNFGIQDRKRFKAS